MQIKTLYRYNRDDGGVSVSPIMPTVPFTVLHRLVADEGKLLTNGEISVSCIDTENKDDWSEIDEISETENEAQGESEG